ncbi:hypothetical protein [Sphingosinicella terrae]|uniref:hypothetical protein n=1 Tax=Sphingosinicella terrae TaxID=2172047 RepID=UPI000E0DCC7E|nr:hypothetical protein [Sphingosinicella terrae]
MARAYENPKPPRFTIAADADGERIVIAARRPVALLAILGLWLVLWLWAGLWGVVQILRSDHVPVLAPLLVWLLGLLLVAPFLAWLATGRELIRVVGGDLEIGRRLLGRTRWRRYRGADISYLAAAATPAWPGLLQPELPFLARRRWGAVKFAYGARTLHAAAGLDEAEGRLIVDWLEPRLAGRVISPRS